MVRLDSLHSSSDEPPRGAQEGRSISSVAPVRALSNEREGTFMGGRDDPASAATLSSRQDAGSGVHLDLSGAAKAMALVGPEASRSSRNADVDETDLPGEIKEMIKRIREIREQLAQKQAELRKVANDQRLRPDVRKMKVAMLQAEIMALTSAFMLASKKLSELIQDSGLNQEQAMVAGQLIMA